MSIEDHEFQDVDVVGSVRVSDFTIEIHLDSGQYIQFDRDDIIEMAKAIELTGDDLK